MGGPIAYRVISSGTPGPVSEVYQTIRYYWDRLLDPSEDAVGLSTEMSTTSEIPFAVTDFTGTFELRKLQWRWSRAPAGRVEDVEVMTFHFIKASGGVPGTYNDVTDLTAVETAATSYFTTYLANYVHSFVHSDQYRWYKDGPAFYHEEAGKPVFQPNGDNPAIRITEVDVAGSGAGSNALPPQCAYTITEKASLRKHWGRYYVPVTVTSLTDGTGLIAGGTRTSLLAAAVAFYNACRAASMLPVVFSNAKPDRPKAGGGTLPAVGAIAYEVAALQMDDIVDIVRSRRFQTGVNKSSTTLT